MGLNATGNPTTIHLYSYSLPQDDEWGDWLEATYDPDNPPYDTLDEQNGHA